MLKEIINAWKGQGFMNGVVEAVGQMLINDEYLFETSWGAFTGKVVIAEVKDEFAERDIAVNKAERRIRRMVLEHLSINPRQDIAGGLAMMSLIKDAERIGDYCKNIFELGTLLNGRSAELNHMQELFSIQSGLAANFNKLRRVVSESDESLAKEIMKDYLSLKSRCSDIIMELFSEELSTREALATVLAARYLKRINSHMSNIASGMVFPLDKMDFVRVRDGLFE